MTFFIVLNTSNNFSTRLSYNNLLLCMLLKMLGLTFLFICVLKKILKNGQNLYFTYQFMG